MSILHWALTALLLVIILLHTASAFFKCNIAKILAYVNISLHIAAIFLFLLADFSLDVVALCFMCDLLLYILINLLSDFLGQRRRGKR